MSIKEIRRKLGVLKRIAKKPLADRKKSAAKRRRSRYATYYKKYKVKNNVILYESSQGIGMTCNPYAIFKAFMKDNSFKKYIHVWSLNSLENHTQLINEYKNYKNVVFVERNSDEYMKVLATAKYLLENTSFPYYFTKKTNQIYINTWHSITVKTLGYDVPEGKVEIANVLRNFISTDYIISANKFNTKIFRNSYKLDGLYEGRIIENGHPRNDLILNTNRGYIHSKLTSYGIEINSSKKLILYAPTWKGTKFFKPKANSDVYFKFISNIDKEINTKEYQILIKPHPAEYKMMSDEDKASGIFVPANIDTNEILSVVDILISDYSSIYFDYMVTDKPVLFYIPDLEEYQDYRGIYFKPDELPGPATKNIDDIADWINNIEEVKKEYSDIYQETKAWACEYDDGNVSEKVIDIVFKGNEKPYNIISDFSNDKKKILIHRGSSKTNGITISLMNLLNNIDYNKYDVTVYLSYPTTGNEIENICKMNDNARVMCRVSTFNSTVYEDFCNGIFRRVGLKNIIARKLFPKKFYEREFRRCFGQSKFDHVIDFSGYSSFFAALLLQDKNAKTFIWQHSDISSEINTRRSIHGQNLKVNLTLFPYYDKIVSATKEVMKVNIKNFATEKTKEKFTYCTNLFDSKRVHESLKDLENSTVDIDGGNHISSGIEEVGDVISVKAPIPIDNNKINFVTIGRMSPEKNHMNLIDGFAKIYEENSDCRLYIIGDGPLRSKMKDNIASMGLSDVVHLTGNLSNPFPLLSQCDCFVFPSLYEAQGLVVLEARMLNLPIILSDFDAAPSVMMENGQLLIGKESNDIYEGMKAFLNGEVPTDYKFDPQEYNKKAYSEFEKLLQ